MYALSLPRLLSVLGRPGKNLSRFRSRERSAGMFIAILIFLKKNFFQSFTSHFWVMWLFLLAKSEFLFSLEITGSVVILLNISSQSVINPIQKTPKFGCLLDFLFGWVLGFFFFFGWPRWRRWSAHYRNLERFFPGLPGTYRSRGSERAHVRF